MYAIDLYTWNELTFTHDVQRFFDNKLPFKEYQLPSATLDLEDGTAGELTFSITEDNIAYNLINPHKSFVKVLQNEKEIWSGRVHSIDSDFYNQKQYTFGGELSYLKDTVQPIKDYGETYLDPFMLEIIRIHNEQIGTVYTQQQGFPNNEEFPNYIKFEWGGLLDPTLINYEPRTTKLETTFEVIKREANKLGLHIRLIKDLENNTIWIYFVKTFNDQPSDPDFAVLDQTINFGKNLLTFSKNISYDSIYIAAAPYTNYNNQLITLDGYGLYSDSDNFVHINWDIYKYFLVNGYWQATYGWKATSLQVTVESGYTGNIQEYLIAKAKEFLKTKQYESINIEISGIDLAAIDPEYENKPLIYQRCVRIISEPHNLDIELPITQMNINLLSFIDNKYSIGYNTTKTLSNVYTDDQINKGG